MLGNQVDKERNPEWIKAKRKFALTNWIKKTTNVSLIMQKMRTNCKINDGLLQGFQIS